jgi:3-hydroxybutyryl-CoA dehydrogenase
MTRERINHAAIIGGGTMGTDIAAIFAAGGWNTHIAEPSDAVRENLPRAVKTSLHTLNADEAFERIRVYAGIENVPWSAVGFVVECVPEDLSIKQSVFRQLEGLSRPDTPLTSNSSSFPISRIGEGLSTPSRMAGLHFFLPAHLVPLVEVVRSEQTNPEIADHIADVMRQLNKRPVLVKRDIPGFLANRLQHALMREVFYLLESGIASAEDIDASVQYGFGIRYLAAGPLLQKDLSGVDIHSKAAAGIYPDLCNTDRPSRVMTQMIAEGHTGVKTGKGFYAWTDDTVKAVKERYEKALLAALEIFKSG